VSAPAQPHDAIAASLLAQHRDGLAFRPLSADQRRGGLEAAYDIQEAFQGLVIAGRRVAIAGHKVALTSRAMQEMVGVDQPLAGAIFDDTVHCSPATLDAGNYQRLGVECEIALRLDADLPGCAEGHTRNSVAAAVGAVVPAFELIEDRNADYGTIDAFSVVADNAWNGGIVLGSPVAAWRAVDLGAARGALTINGAAISHGIGADALGHPLNALAWLADHMAARGRPLARGMIVMTGSIVKTVFPEPGDALEFTLEGFGAVAMGLR
jgi:2-keto-4-pentenoate hydratase